MLGLIGLLNFQYLDQPDCEPLLSKEAGESPMCINTLNKGKAWDGKLGGGAGDCCGRRASFSNSSNVSLFVGGKGEKGLEGRGRGGS